MDLDGTTVYSAAYEGSGDDVYNHDVEWTPSDSIIGLVGTRTRTSGRAISGFEILEHDPVTSEVLFDWDSQTAYDAGQLDAGAGSDPWHANALANVVDALGAGVYVNLYGSGQVVRVDKASGDISFILGRGQDVALQDASGHPLGDEGWFDAAHGMGIFDGDKLVQYDNGVTTGVSRIVEYQLDPVAQTARLLFEWNEGYYNPNWGDVDLLSDGNFLVDEPATWCTGGQDSPGSILIVDRSDSSVPWRLRFTDRDDSSYRAQWVDGCDLFGNSKYCG